MANTDNLLKGNPETQFRSGREAVENGQKGGIASGEARRQRKTFKEMAEMLLSLPIKDESTRDFLKSQGFKEEDLNNDLIEIFSMHQQILQGNVRAFEAIRDTIGEKPTDKVALEEAPQIVLKRPDK